MHTEGGEEKLPKLSSSKNLMSFLRVGHDSIKIKLPLCGALHPSLTSRIYIYKHRQILDVLDTCLLICTQCLPLNHADRSAPSPPRQTFARKPTAIQKTSSQGLLREHESKRAG